MNCLGWASLLRGQNRLPIPPAMITLYTISVLVKPEDINRLLVGNNSTVYKQLSHGSIKKTDFCKDLLLHGMTQ